VFILIKNGIQYFLFAKVIGSKFQLKLLGDNVTPDEKKKYYIYIWYKMSEQKRFFLKQSDSAKIGVNIT